MTEQKQVSSISPQVQQLLSERDTICRDLLANKIVKDQQGEALGKLRVIQVELGNDDSPKVIQSNLFLLRDLDRAIKDKSDSLDTLDDEQGTFKQMILDVVKLLRTVREIVDGSEELIMPGSEAFDEEEDVASNGTMSDGRVESSRSEVEVGSPTADGGAAIQPDNEPEKANTGTDNAAFEFLTPILTDLSVVDGFGEKTTVSLDNIASARKFVRSVMLIPEGVVALGEKMFDFIPLLPETLSKQIDKLGVLKSLMERISATEDGAADVLTRFQILTELSEFDGRYKDRRALKQDLKSLVKIEVYKLTGIIDELALINEVFKAVIMNDPKHIKVFALACPKTTYAYLNWCRKLSRPHHTHPPQPDIEAARKQAMPPFEALKTLAKEFCSYYGDKGTKSDALTKMAFLVMHWYGVHAKSPFRSRYCVDQNDRIHKLNIHGSSIEPNRVYSLETAINNTAKGGHRKTSGWGGTRLPVGNLGSWDNVVRAVEDGGMD